MSSSLEPINASNQPPPSPWKKPKVVSLSRSKSLKRKTDLLNSNSSTENDELTQPQPKITRNIFNRFSIGANLTHTSSLSSEVAIIFQIIFLLILKI